MNIPNWIYIDFPTCFSSWFPSIYCHGPCVSQARSGRKLSANPTEDPVWTISESACRSGQASQRRISASTIKLLPRFPRFSRQIWGAKNGGATNPTCSVPTFHGALFPRVNEQLLEIRAWKKNGGSALGFWFCWKVKSIAVERFAYSFFWGLP